jgi:hypothetical protein
MTGSNLLKLQSEAVELKINRPILKGAEVVYSSGMVVRPWFCKSVLEEASYAKLHESRENVEIYELDPKRFSQEIKKLCGETFRGLIESERKVRIYHIIKRSGGFSRFSHLGIDIPEDGKVVLVSRSNLGKKFENFCIGEDHRKSGSPWIQLYRLDPEKAMFLDRERVYDLLITPSEEILFRDFSLSAQNLERSKITTRIDMFVFQ